MSRRLVAFAPLAQYADPGPFTTMMIRTSVPPGIAIKAFQRRMTDKHPEVNALFDIFL